MGRNPVLGVVTAIVVSVLALPGAAGAEAGRANSCAAAYRTIDHLSTAALPVQRFTVRGVECVYAAMSVASFLPSKEGYDADVEGKRQLRVSAGGAVWGYSWRCSENFHSAGFADFACRGHGSSKRHGSHKYASMTFRVPARTWDRITTGRSCKTPTAGTAEDGSVVSRLWTSLNGDCEQAASIQNAMSGLDPHGPYPHTRTLLKDGVTTRYTCHRQTDANNDGSGEENWDCTTPVNVANGHKLYTWTIDHPAPASNTP